MTGTDAAVAEGVPIQAFLRRGWLRLHQCQKQKEKKRDSGVGEGKVRAKRRKVRWSGKRWRLVPICQGGTTDIPHPPFLDRREVTDPTRNCVSQLLIAFVIYSSSFANSVGFDRDDLAVFRSDSFKNSRREDCVLVFDLPGFGRDNCRVVEKGWIFIIPCYPPQVLCVRVNSKTTPRQHPVLASFGALQGRSVVVGLK